MCLLSLYFDEKNDSNMWRINSAEAWVVGGGVEGEAGGNNQTMRPLDISPQPICSQNDYILIFDVIV